MIISKEHLETIAGQKTKLISILPEWINKICPEFEIDTPREYAHFLAQACHETDHFRTFEEYASGKAYEGRKDLGNVIIGDGIRFKGRGIFQTTGRANYKDLSDALGMDFVSYPDELSEPEWAVRSAMYFWQSPDCNELADYGLFEKITRTINGGLNGYPERLGLWERAKEALA